MRQWVLVIVLPWEVGFAASAGAEGNAVKCEQPAAISAKDDGERLYNSAVFAVNELLRDRDHRPKDGKVKWAELKQVDGKFSASVADSTDTYCTNVTHAAFVKFIADACNANPDECNASTLACLNSKEFRLTWNSGGPAQAALVDLMKLGQSSQLFDDEINVFNPMLMQARRGDIVQFTKKSNNGHSVIFDQFCGNQLCYISSDGPSKGEYKKAGWACEPIANIKQISLTRVNQLGNLKNVQKFCSSFHADHRFQKVKERESYAVFGSGDVPGMTSNFLKEWKPAIPVGNSNSDLPLNAQAVH